MGIQLRRTWQRRTGGKAPQDIGADSITHPPTPHTLTGAKKGEMRGKSPQNQREK